MCFTSTENEDRASLDTKMKSDCTRLCTSSTEGDSKLLLAASMTAPTAEIADFSAALNGSASNWICRWCEQGC